MNNKMKKIICALALSCMSITAYAGTVFTRSAVSGQTDYFRFSFAGGALDIDIWGNNFSGGPNMGLDDPLMGLFADDGSPDGALTGALLDLNDDGGAAGYGDGSTSDYDSFLSFASLTTGSYVLAVDHWKATETVLRTGIGSEIHGNMVDYQLTFSSDVTPLTSPVPIPAAVWLFGSGLLGLLGFGRFRKRG